MACHGKRRPGARAPGLFRTVLSLLRSYEGSSVSSPRKASIFADRSRSDVRSGRSDPLGRCGLAAPLSPLTPLSPSRGERGEMRSPHLVFPLPPCDAQEALVPVAAEDVPVCDGQDALVSAGAHGCAAFPPTDRQGGARGKRERETARRRACRTGAGRRARSSRLRSLLGYRAHAPFVRGRAHYSRGQGMGTQHDEGPGLEPGAFMMGPHSPRSNIM